MIPPPDACLPVSDLPRTPERPPITRVATFANDVPVPALARAGSAGAACDAIEFTPLRLESRNLDAALRRMDAAVVVDHGGDVPPGSGPLAPLLRGLREARLGAVVLTRRPQAFTGAGAGVLCLAPDAEPQRLRGALLALATLRPVLRRIDLELTRMKHLGDRLAEHFEAVDRELRLAARLQRDFLPRDLPRVEGLRFTTLFRPCSCVSGDFFDLFRPDDRHVGLYLADAMGHGVSAGLLTIFIKSVLQPGTAAGIAGDPASPRTLLARLNDALAAHDLPESQFVTAWYGLIDLRTFTLRYACGGHPPPLLIEPDGTPALLRADGCLLGVFPGQKFEERSVTLRPGCRVVVYSDGLTSTLFAPDSTAQDAAELSAAGRDLLRLQAEQLVDALTDLLDSRASGPPAVDDASLIVVDVTQEPAD